MGKRSDPSGKTKGLGHAPPKKVQRTPKTPFQASRAQTEEFFPEEIVSKSLKYGCPQYEVKWKGYSDTENTHEPIENLIGHEKMVQDFEVWWDGEYKRKQEETRLEVTKKREEKARKQQDEAAARMLQTPQRITEDDDGESGSDTEALSSSTKGNKGRSKRSPVWKSNAFKAVVDRSGRVTGAQCMLKHDCGVEGEEPKECLYVVSVTNGSTTPLWTHLEDFHNDVYTRLKWVSVREEEKELCV
jgi:hypothetical protein